MTHAMVRRRIWKQMAMLALVRAEVWTMKQAGFERLARETESAARAAKSEGERAALLTIAQSYRSLAALANDPFLLVGEPAQRETFPIAPHPRTSSSQ
jgi:hypothetical protein